MNLLAVSSLGFVLLSCASRPHWELVASVEPPDFQGRVLAFQALRETEGAPDPGLTFARRTIEVAAGDVLEYDFYPAGVPAERAGVEIVFVDGSVLAPPALSADTGWVHERIPLDAHAGSKTASFHLVARGAAPEECVFYVNNVVIRSAKAGATVLFDGTLESAWREERDGASRAACFTVEKAERYPRRAVPAGKELPGEPWALIDLTVFRRAQALRTGAVRASEASAHPASAQSIPTGVVFLDAGTPFGFAREGEAESFPAEGQRVALGSVEGGRYYDLHLALAVEGAAAIDTQWQILGRRNAARALAIHVDPSAETRAGFDFVTLSVPIASDFAIESLRLPQDPRLRVFAVSLRWRKDGPTDPAFRRRWLAQEVGGEKLARYFHDVDLGPMFAHLAGSPILSGEDARERQLFDLALRGERAAFDELLASRLSAFEDASAKFKTNHIAFVGRSPAGVFSSWAAARESSVRELQHALEAARASPEISWARPAMQSVAWLRERDPESFAELCRAAEAERVDLARGAWAGDGTGGSSESMARGLLLGRKFAAQHLARGKPASGRAAEALGGAVGILPRDLSYGRQLPQLCRSAGIRLLVGSRDGAQCDRPAAFRWTAPDGSSVDSAEWVPPTPEGVTRLEEKDLARRLRQARGNGERADVLVAFDVGDDSAEGRQTLRRNLATIEGLARADLAPSVSLMTPSTWLARLRAEDKAPLPDWDGAREFSQGCRRVQTPSRIRAANRRAEAALKRAERYAALARGDGLSYPREEFDDLWKRLLWNQSFESGAESLVSAVEDEARRIVERAHELTRAELSVLVRSANTQGPGQPIAVYNSLPWDRVEPIEIPEAGVSVLDSDLRPVVSQLTASGARVFLASLPAFGRAVFHLVPGTGSAPVDRPVPSAEQWTLANGELRVELDPKTGHIRSLRLMPGGEELLARDGMGGNVTLLFPRDGAASPGDGAASRGDGAAPPGTQPVVIDQLDSIRILERGPVRSVARIERTIQGARLVQDLVLYADAAELTLRTRIEGGTGRDRLCSAFEIEAVSPWVVHGVPFGSTARPCAKSDIADEIRALDWISQSTSQTSFTLCNDSGATFGAGGRILSVTLDDADYTGARRPREVECTLHVGRESWRAGALHAAAEVEHPPQVVRAEPHDGVRPPRHSFLRLSRLGPNGKPLEGQRSSLMITAFKVAEEGDDWVVRFYEARGEAGTARLTFDRPIFAAHGTDLLEHPTAELRILGTQVEIPIAPYRIETVRVSIRPR